MARVLLPTLVLNLLAAYPVFWLVRKLFPLTEPTAREVIAAAE